MKKVLLVLLIVCRVQNIICMTPVVPPPTGEEVELFQAIKEGNKKKVRELIEAGLNVAIVRMVEGEEQSPYSYAAEKAKTGKTDIMQMLLKAGEISQQAESTRRTEAEFIAALEKGDVATAQNLVGKVAKDTVAEAIWDALKDKNLKKFETVLSSAPFAHIDFLDAHQNTPLLVAVKDLLEEVKNKNIQDIKNVKDIVDIINVILIRGPNPSRKNDKGETALNLAMRITKVADEIVNGTIRKEIFKLLDAVQVTEAFNAAQAQYDLLSEVYSKDLDSVKKASPELLKFNAQGLGNPLALAILENNLDIVKYLVQEGKKVDANFVNRKSPRTPLMVALNENNKAIVEYLLQQGADPNIEINIGGFGRVPFDWVLWHNNIEMMKLLESYKADINHQMFPDMSTFLMKAAWEEKFDMVKELLALGANPSLENLGGQTARKIVQDKVETPKVQKDENLKKIYEEIISLLEEKEKSFPKREPIITTPPSQLISAVQKLTQTLQALNGLIT